MTRIINLHYEEDPYEDDPYKVELRIAPPAEHVNIHAHALHLFGRLDGKPVLPDFTRGTGSI